jgi:hypothetical protein
MHKDFLAASLNCYSHFYSQCSRYSDKDLANLLAVKAALCGKKFEVKINEILFVGFPLQIYSSSDAASRRQMSTLSSFNVVFALRVIVLNHSKAVTV